MSIQDSLSPRSIRCLQRAGWFPGRTIDTEVICQHLSREGFVIHDAARSFIAEFGNLVVRNPLEYHRILNWIFGKRYCHSDFRTRIVDLLPRKPSGYLKEYERAVSSPLCFIGDACTGYLFLYMASNGAVYGGYDATLVLVGNSAAEAINSLCQGFQNLPLPNLLEPE